MTRFCIPLCLLLAACDSGPECPGGSDPLEAMPSPLDEFETFSAEAYICDRSGKPVLFHPATDGDEASIAARYAEGVGGMRPATPEDSYLDLKIYGGRSGVPLLMATDAHVYLLEVQEESYYQATTVTVEDKSDTRMPEGAVEVAAEVVPKATALDEALKGASGRCPAAGMTEDVLLISPFLLTDLRQNRGGTSAVKNQKIAEALLKAPIIAAPVELERVEPEVDEQARTFKPGRLNGQVVFIASEDNSVICAAPYWAESSLDVSAISWSDGSSNAQQSVMSDLTERGSEAVEAALTGALGDAKLQRAQALKVEVAL